MNCPQLVIGVDIGNSGLRVAELKMQGEIDGHNFVQRCVGKTLRLDWRPRSNEQSDSTITRTFHPNSETWFTEFERMLQQVLIAADLSRSIASSEGTRQWPTVRCFISSVRRDALSHLVSYLDNHPKFVSHIVSHSDIDLDVDVDSANRVGVDRLLAARGALACCAVRPLIVVQAGSAVTVDWVDELGAFAGGAIVPGVPMMLRLLAQAADMLPQIESKELVELPSLPGKNTEQAMLCGVSSAVVGGTKHLIGRYRKQFGAHVPVILSGGDGPRLARHLRGPKQVVNQLVMVGLALVARRLLAR